MRSWPVLAAFAFVVGTAACGGDDGGGGGGGIDAPTIDATPIDSTPIDGPMVTGLGMACTGAGQGNCPTGFTCLGLQGGSGSWCSKMCTQGAGDMCAQGYTGPGLAACFLRVTPAGGGADQFFCGIICDDPAGAPDICQPGQCTGTCPAPLACTAALMNTGGMTVAHGCQ